MVVGVRDKGVTRVNHGVSCGDGWGQIVVGVAILGRKCGVGGSNGGVANDLGFWMAFLHFVGNSLVEDNNEKHVDDLDVQLFDLPTITTATNDFSLENKIGEGGFGPVYKGILTDGQEITVKTLSRSSWQGVTEFINEVKLIAKLQHRNLVKLLGCCIQGQEKMLIYEYMANSSLDSFIFGMQYPEDRPTMATVILMLESHIELVEPKEHGFIPRNVSAEENLHLNQKDTSSTNDVTITILEAR
ncbi:G-type lectin S-receptor serine/threonine-protein kinase SD1-1 [Spatholobus suberectus]|nr:G-type lectin S-receptor serine/threonine-protein kinase SD1-1 [Spatholobus suberectus]